MIPVGKQNNEQFIYIIDKDKDGKVNTKSVLSVKYVPLTTIEKQLKNLWILIAQKFYKID